MRHLSPLVLVAFAVAAVFVACSGCAPKAKPIDGKVADAVKANLDGPAAQGQPDGTAEPDGQTETSAEAGDVANPGFDHSSYAELLTKYVRWSEGRVDYAGLKADQAALDEYLESLAEADLTKLSRDEQLALLINAYNACTLALIVENYGEIDSIRDLSDPWGDKRWKVGGDTLSLDDIEHGLIRPLFKDPRIHFAVNCASIGCPPLADFAFTGDDLDDQLDRVTSAALQNPRYAKASGGKLHLTKIMDWYGEDFTKDGWAPTAETLPQWVAPRSTDEVRAYVEKGDPKVTFLEYDWSLNDVE
jgi:hypothetical protein